MARNIVCSFYVSRPLDFPNAAPYIEMLRILDRSCKRAGFEHGVLTDYETAPSIEAAGILPLPFELPRSLMKATTEAHAAWLESPLSVDCNTTYVGADCIIRKDFKKEVPACDLAITYMPGRKWQIMNGFMHIRSKSRKAVAPLYRTIANDTSEEMCDDMLAVERALAPMPEVFGQSLRKGLTVNFLPLRAWNHCVKHPEYPARDAFVMHFNGGWHNGKQLFFDWTRRWMPELMAEGVGRTISF